jgi:hypothetical protein
LEYYSLVQEYCKRQLTKTSDKLPAFSGIATNLQPVLGGDYLAGIWASDLTRGLLWTRGYNGGKSDVTGYSGWESEGHSVFRKDPNAPSWSWASARGIIAYYDLDLRPSPWQIRLLSHEVVPVDRTNPFGQVKSAQIVVEGFTIPISPTSSDIDIAQSVKAAEVELTQSAKDSINLYHPLVATTQPANHPSSTVPSSDSKEKLTEGDRVWDIIDRH